MKRPTAVFISVAFAAGISSSVAAATTACSQPSTFFAGALSIDHDVNETRETEAFAAKLVTGLQKGDRLAVQMGEGQAWTMLTVAEISKSAPSSLGKYPILGTVKCADTAYTIMPAVLKLRVDVQAGEPVRVGGYELLAKRPAKKGDSIPVLSINESWLALDENGQNEPWFTAYKDEASQDRSALLEAWRITKRRSGR
jgi:hypothetical protein